MTFLLRVDRDKWSANARDVVQAHADPGAGGSVIPVAKGNGYGLGQARLAHQARSLGADTLAVGTVFEALDPELPWAGQLSVLTPYEPADDVASPVWEAARDRYGDRLVITIAEPPALRHLLSRSGPQRPARVLVKGLTATRRFGMEPAAVLQMLSDPEVHNALSSGALQLAGLSLHPPLAQPDPGNRSPDAMFRDLPPINTHFSGSGKAEQVSRWGMQWIKAVADLDARIEAPPQALSEAVSLWVSHLTRADLAAVRASLPNVPVRPRIGTAMWLGAPNALAARGIVLAVHETDGVGGVGYRQRRLPGGTRLIVVGGGTAHGVAMAAPDPVISMKRRVTVAGTGAMEAMGRAMSPFRWDGKRLWFAEPPHATVSLLRLPKGIQAPPVGAELPCEVRYTTIRFDTVIGLD